MKHNLVLTLPCVWLLTNLLSRPGWARTEGDAFRAAKIQNSLPDLDVPDKVLNGASQRSAIKDEPLWCKTSHPLSLTDRQRDCVKTCLRHQISEGNLVNGPWSLELMTVFGLTPEDEITDEKAPAPSPETK